MRERSRAGAVLVFPPGSGGTADTRIRKGLGACYVAAYLAKNGYKAVPLEWARPVSTATVVALLQEYRPAVIGFTVYNDNYYACKAVAEAAKAARPGMLCVFGGPTPTVVPEAVLRDAPCVDVCVRGRGEDALLEILDALSEHGDPFCSGCLDAFAKVAGINFRRDGCLQATPEADFPQRDEQGRFFLDRYPSPYLTGFLAPEAAVSAGVTTARGCNQHCTYCNCAVLWKNRIYPHSVERVLEELDWLSRSEYVAGVVRICDDAFNLMPRRAEQICRGIIDNGIRLSMGCQARCDLMSEDLLRLMKEAGFTELGISLESAVPRVLRAIGKVASPDTPAARGLSREQAYLESVRDCVRWARRIGFHRVSVSFMSGLPGESRRDAEQTRQFVKELAVDFFFHNPLRVYPGTPLYDAHRRAGREMDDLDGLLPFPRWEAPVASADSLRPLPAMPRKAVLGAHVQSAAVLSLQACGRHSGREGACGEKGYFTNVVLFREDLSEAVVRWMKRNLAVAGRVVHVYEKEAGKQGFREIERLLCRNVSPTLNYRSYRRVSPADRDGPGLVSQGKAGIRRVKFSDLEGLDSTGTPGSIVSVCAVEDSEDLEAFRRFLTDMGEAGDPFRWISEVRPVPLVERLCMWLCADANCRALETALVDSSGSVRICPHAEPSGTLANTFEEIKEGFRRQRQKETSERGCSSCCVRDTCVRCAYPAPLDPQEYCRARRMLGEESAAEVVRAFHGSGLAGIMD